MKKLVLSTKESIHDPIEVEIDGKLYKNNPLSRSLFDQVKKYEQAAVEGDLEALYKQVQLIYSIPLEVLNKMDIRDINSLLEYTMAQVYKSRPATEKEQAEKNGLKPGEGSSA